MQQAAQSLLEVPAQDVPRRALDADFVGKLGKPRDFTSVDVAKGASEVLAESAALAPDSATSAKVASSALENITNHQAWAPPPGSDLQRSTMSMLRSACDKASSPMLLLRSLFHYLERAKSNQVEILAEAAVECKRLLPQYAVPALVAGHQSLSNQVEILAGSAVEYQRLPPQYAVLAIVAGHQSLSPLLPETADLAANTPMATIKKIVGVKHCVALLTWKAGDPAGVLEALGGLLPPSATSSSASRVQQLHYHHLAVKGLQSMFASGKGPALESVPTEFLTKMLQAFDEVNSQANLEALSVRNRAAADAIALAQQPPKLAELMRLQDDLHRQLDVAAPHTPGQLASAGTLYMNAARVTAPSVAPRMCALLVEAMQGAHDAATTRPVPSLETLYVGGHCMRVLSRQFGAAEREPVVPEGVCESIQITGEPPRLLATHAQNESKASAVLQDLTRSGRINAYLKESIAALASSPQIKKHFADPTAPAFRVFTPMAAVAKAGALSASRSIARSADGASDASATLASQPPKESQHPPQQLKQFDALQPKQGRQESGQQIKQFVEVQRLISSPQARAAACSDAANQRSMLSLIGREPSKADSTVGPRDAMQTASHLLDGVSSARHDLPVAENEAGAAGHAPEPMNSLGESSSMGDTVLKPPPGAAMQGPFAAGPATRLGQDSEQFVRLEGAGGGGGGLEGLMHEVTTPERRANLPPMGQSTPPSAVGGGASGELLQIAAGRSRSVHALQQPGSPSNSTNFPLQYPSGPDSPSAVLTSASVSTSLPPRPGGPSSGSLRPAPINVTRTSLHAIPAASVAASAPHSPTSSIGGFSSASHSGARTSIHAIPRAARSGPLGAGPAKPNPALAARVAADNRMSRGALMSPMAGGSIVSGTSSARRRARASLHVLPRAATPS